MIEKWKNFLKLQKISYNHDLKEKVLLHLSLISMCVDFYQNSTKELLELHRHIEKKLRNFLPIFQAI